MGAVQFDYVVVEAALAPTSRKNAVPENHMTHREKLARARVHLAALQSMLVEYRNSEPFSTQWSESREAPSYPRRHHLLRVKRVKDLPSELPLLVGDTLFNLRSALDHLAFSLAKRNTGTLMNERHPYFPICGDSRDWANPRVGLKRALDLLAPSARDAIERLQPYHDPSGAKANPLFVLDELNNQDKHRHLVFHGALNAEALFSMLPSAHNVRIERVHPSGLTRISEEEEYFSADLLVTGPDPRFGVHAQLVMSFTLPDDGPAPDSDLLPLLGSISRHIETTVFPLLEPYLS